MGGSKTISFDTFIFIPAYNVGKNLTKVLYAIPESVWNRSKILIINDGSKDDTENYAVDFLNKVRSGALLKSVDRAEERLEYFRFGKNSGYGAVVKKGLAEGIASRAKFVACLHGDGQYPADMLDMFLEHLENFRTEDGKSLALLQGSRRAVDGDAKAGRMPFYKRMGGSFLTAVENFFFKCKLTDRHSGFILYNTKFLRRVNLNTLSASFDVDLQLIALADSMFSRSGSAFTLGELPIPTVYADETSNLHVVSYGIRCLLQVWRRSWMR